MSWKVYPDVILHKRGSNDDNILIIEFKTYWNDNQYNDYAKIKEFTDLSGRYAFHNGMAILIAMRRKDVTYRGFIGGKEHEVKSSIDSNCSQR